SPRACAPSARSRRSRSRGWHGCSSFGSHQADEDFLQRALTGVQVLEDDAELVELAQEPGDAARLELRVARVDQVVAIRAQLEMRARERRRNGRERALQVQRELPAAEL